MAKTIVKLTFPQKLVKKPITFQMAKKYDIMPNIRRARVSETIGEIVMVLEGKQDNLEKALVYLKKAGVVVEPVVGDIVE